MEVDLESVRLVKKKVSVKEDGVSESVCLGGFVPDLVRGEWESGICRDEE